MIKPIINPVDGSIEPGTPTPVSDDDMRALFPDDGEVKAMFNITEKDMIKQFPTYAEKKHKAARRRRGRGG